MKYLTNSGLSYFLNKIKAYIASQLNSKANLTHTHSASDITSGLATVATSGSYNDLSNKPTIPSKTSDLTNDSGFLTSHQDLSGYVPRGGGTVLNGSSFSRNVNNSELQINGGTGWGQGASIALGGKDKTGNTGVVYLHAGDSTSFNQLEVCPNGEVKQNVNGTIKNIAMQEDTVPRSGGAVMAGWLGKTTDSTNFSICGATSDAKGATMWLYGNDNPNYTGGVRIKLTDSNAGEHWFTLYPNGYAGWNGKTLAMQEDVIPRSLGSVITGTTLGKTTDNSWLALCGGKDISDGCMVQVMGKNHDGASGRIYLRLIKTNEQKDMMLYSSGTWTWNGAACQITSDQRLKQQISEIDDKLLDAWEDVDLVQFKYNDAVDQKGKDKARLHTGYVVQQIDKACKSHGVDVSQYGLYCHEEYPQETEEVEVEQEDGTKTKETKVIREASEHYSLRYTETLVVECAYLRKQIKELKERLEKLEGK